MSVDHPSPEPHQEVEPVAPEVEATYTFAVVDHDDPRAEEGRQIERDVFLEAFDNTPELLKKEYDPYEQASRFVIIHEIETGKATGVIRLVHNSPAGLKSLNDVETGPWGKPIEETLGRTSLAPDIDKTLDIATYAIIKEYRREKDSLEATLTQLALFRAVILHLEEVGAIGLIGITDDRVVARTQENAGDPFQYYPGVGSKPYLGSKGSTPIWADMREYIPRLQLENPKLYDSYFNGVGYDFLRSAEASE